MSEGPAAVGPGAGPSPAAHISEPGGPVQARDGVVQVLVAVCTFRRPEQLVALLESLVGQRLPDEVRVRVLVVDNSPGSEAEPAVRRFADRAVLDVIYNAYGATNIASGRNEALRLVPEDVDFIAFVDDDELADPDWLANLVLAQRRTSADIVTGPVLAIYPASTPGWRRSDVLYSVVGPDPGAFVEEAVTGNALLRAAVVRELDLSFDTTLGTSGGEDQLFFRTARARGARLWFEPSAVVRETIPAERLSLRYLLRREYRKGNTLGLLDRSRPGWPAGSAPRRVLKAVYWAVTGIAGVLVAITARNRTAAVVGGLRLARSVGMMSGLRGSTFHLYGRAAASPPPPVLALVAQEDPDYQQAGHSHFLRGFVSHYESLGLRVVVIVTDGRLSFLVRRPGMIVYRSPGVIDVAGWQVAVAPRLIARWLAWRVFRSAPRVAQNAVDRVRTAARSGRRVDHILGRDLDAAQTAHLRAVLAADRPDAVLFNGLFSVPRPLELPESVRATGLICMDVVSERAADLRSHGYRVTPPDFNEAREGAGMSGMSAVIAIQWDDAEVFRRLAPADSEVVVCPVSVTAGALVRDPQPGRCLFVGSGSLPNVDGLRWFLDACWPAVRRACPHAELHVVGTVCARTGAVPRGVLLRGEVDDLAPEYAAASAVLVPLRTGSGLKVKIIEALVHGAAVVTTPVGAQGLSGLPASFLVAEGDAAFADEVVRVLSDDDTRICLERAAKASAPRFSPDRAFAELDRHLTDRGVLSTGTPRISSPLRQR